MHLSDEEKQIGRDNYARVLDESLKKHQPNRREAMGAVLAGGAVIGAGLGATYFGYSKSLGDPLRVGIIGTGDEGNVLIGALNPEFVEVKAIADIRPYSIHRAFHGDQGALDARPGLMNVYGWKTEDEARKNVKVYENDYNELLEDPDIEAVIIALPLWIHDQAAIAAMRAQKHVLTEKLMAHSVRQCKEMARVAYDTDRLLATGHQRHYSVLYDNAVDTIRRGLIGDIHHIRAQWHRGNLPGSDSWQPPLPPEGGFTYSMFDTEIRDLERAKANGKIDQATLEKGKRQLASLHPLLAKLRSAQGKLNSAKGIEVDSAKKLVDQIKAQIADASVDAKKYGYLEEQYPEHLRTALEELIRWRLFNRTGGGLMAELGSHQLDASGIFVSSQFPGKVKVRPLSVVGVGGRHLFPPDRDVDDHVYCTYEYPSKGYFEDNDPTKEVADPNKKVVVTYSSINGNGYGGYGEVVLGTAGTLILDREQETMLFGTRGTKTSVGLNKGKDVLDSYETGGGTTNLAAAALSGPISRGYTEEIEHWAWCIRNNEPIDSLHCHPKVALADAVIALTSNIAMAENRRIEFKPEWFDPMSDETPEGVKPKKADDIA